MNSISWYKGIGCLHLIKLPNVASYFLFCPVFSLKLTDTIINCDDMGDDNTTLGPGGVL